jgi:hypothetical protein
MSRYLSFWPVSLPFAWIRGDRPFRIEQSGVTSGRRSLDITRTGKPYATASSCRVAASRSACHSASACEEMVRRFFSFIVFGASPSFSSS